MKKIIISVLIALLLVLAYFAIFEGISLGKFEVLSVKQIISEDNELDSTIANIDNLQKVQFVEKQATLSTEVEDLLDKKEEYFNLAKISTEGEISKANTEEVYLIEYLWTRVGRHATSEGVNLKMDVNNGDTTEDEVKNLSFTMKGKYVGIIDFIYSIEDDSELNFKIENFKMVPDSESEDRTILIATFDVKNIRIKKEKTTVTDTSTDTNTDENNNTNTTNDVQNTNTVNTNNTVDTNAGDNSIS